MKTKEEPIVLGSYDIPLRERIGNALREYVWTSKLLARIEGESYAPFLATLKQRAYAASHLLAKEADALLHAALEREVSLPDLELALQTFQALGGDQKPVLTEVQRQVLEPQLARAMGHASSTSPLDPRSYADDDERAKLHTLTRLVFGEIADCRAAVPLVSTLNGILTVASQLAPVFAVAERVGGASLDVFNDGLWRVAAARLVDEHGSALFFVGRPDAFHRNYTMIQQFLARLAECAPSARARAAFAAHEATKSLERRWQLSAFFHLRARETVTELEAALQGASATAGFEHGEMAQLLYAFLLPWRATRHIPALAAREWRLSLHVLSRYATWLEAHSPTSDEEAQPAAGESESLAKLRRWAALLADAQLLEERVQASFAQWLMPKIVPATEQSEEAETVRAALREALDASLGPAASLAPRVGAAIVAALQRRCAEPLRHVRAASSQYRALSGARLDEVRASAFIYDVFRPLRQFLGEVSAERYETTPVARLAPDVRQQWAREVIDATLARYATAIETITHNLESLRRLKRGAPALQTEPGADTGVYAQLRADVAALEQDVEALARHTGLDLATDAWQPLQARVVQPAD